MNQHDSRLEWLLNGGSAEDFIRVQAAKSERIHRHPNCRCSLRPLFIWIQLTIKYDEDGFPIGVRVTRGGE